jgi:hypothetical protein
MMLHVRVIGIVIEPNKVITLYALRSIVARLSNLGATCAYLLAALRCLDPCGVRTGEQQRDIERISVDALLRSRLPGRRPTDSRVVN